MDNFKVINKVKAAIVDFANKNGINLAKEFGTVDAFNKWVVAVAITTLVEGGMDIREAFDTVMGDGSFTKLADEVWAINNA